MTLSPTATEWVEAYEQEHGHKPAELVIQVIKHIDKVGDMLKKRGMEDAQKGEKEYPADVFPTLVRKAFRIDPEEDPETVHAIADLWQSDYTDGYTSTEAE